MYVGLASVYAGIALWFGLTWGLLLLPVVLVLIHYLVIVREERYLERKFGEAYGRYRARVRRWI
nr:isoprenylcysteine carboxylmethyltransferase family protein [Deinococcota bacterium]